MLFKQRIRMLRDTVSIARRLSKVDQILDPVERKLGAFPVLSKLVARYGFEIYNQSLSWLNDDEFWALWSKSPFFGKQRPDRKFVAWNIANATSRLNGDTAECGVLDGATSYLVLSANKLRSPEKHHYMFDSWQGLSEPDSIDKDIPDDAAYRWKRGDLSVDEKVALHNLGDFERFTSLKGWIPDRFPEVADKQFSFVHIDVDLYEPTLASLEFFYDRVVPGGVILCDDYGSEACPGARKAFDDVARSKSDKQVFHLPTGQGFIQK